MRIVFCVTGEIPGTSLRFGDLIVIGDGRAPRALVELDVDYGRLGMALLDERIRPLSSFSAAQVLETLELADLALASGQGGSPSTSPRIVDEGPQGPLPPQAPAQPPSPSALRTDLKLLK